MKKNLLKKTVALSVLMAMTTPTVAFGETNLESQPANVLLEYLYSKCDVMELFKDWYEQQGNNVIQKPSLENWLPQIPNLEEMKPQRPNPEVSVPQKPEGDSKPQKPGVDNEQQKPESDNQQQSPSGSYEAQVLQLVNQERAKVGLPALTYNSKLANVADIKAADMRDNNYFSHTSPNYGSPFDMMKKFGIQYSSAGENIAKGQKSPEAVMKAWMNSSGHRANILSSSYEQIGIGYEVDKNGNTYWVQMFIK